MSRDIVPTPVSADTFAAAFAPLAPAGPLAVAVSGGSDSLALLFLAHRWAAENGRDIQAVTVDHGLRAEASMEARWVAEMCAARGIAHTTLVWEGRKPTANLQAAAREARYRLMTDWARTEGVTGLLLAHTEDDQAETVLLRLARGSGVDGLAGMSSRNVLASVMLLRPLLGVSRLRLRATLMVLGEHWLEDPSNKDPRFARPRMRALLPALAEEGLTVPRLAGTARRMMRAREALETATAELLSKTAHVEDAGFIRLASEPLVVASEEIGLRALAKALRAVGGADYPLRLKHLEALFYVLREKRLGRGRTLAGCRVLPGSGGGVLLVREPAQIETDPLPLAPGRVALWDRRFEVMLGAHGPSGAWVSPLGAGGATALKTERSRSGANDFGPPAVVRPSLPCLWFNGEPAAVPHLGYVRPASGLEPGQFQARFTGL